MRTALYKYKAVHTPRRAFTLVELMVVVVIVGILAMVMIAYYRPHVTSTKMTEGIAGCGSIRTSLRVYAATHGGRYPTLAGVDGAGLSVVRVLASDLNGKYFRATDYTVSSTSDSYTIRVTLTADSEYWYELDEEGNESANYLLSEGGG